MAKMKLYYSPVGNGQVSPPNPNDAEALKERTRAYPAQLGRNADVTRSSRGPSVTVSIASIAFITRPAFSKFESYQAALSSL